MTQLEREEQKKQILNLLIEDFNKITTSKDIWEVDTSLVLFRKKLKDIGEKLPKLFNATTEDIRLSYNELKQELDPKLAIFETLIQGLASKVNTLENNYKLNTVKKGSTQTEETAKGDVSEPAKLVPQKPGTPSNAGSPTLPWVSVPLIETPGQEPPPDIEWYNPNTGLGFGSLEDVVQQISVKIGEIIETLNQFNNITRIDGGHALPTIQS